MVLKVNNEKTQIIIVLIYYKTCKKWEIIKSYGISRTLNRILNQSIYNLIFTIVTS